MNGFTSSSVGELCRNGRAVYYVVIGDNYIESFNRAELEAELALVTKPAAKVRKLKRYEVHMTLKCPAWDEHKGYVYEVSAYSKADANKAARRIAEERDGHVAVGPKYFSAREIE